IDAAQHQAVEDLLQQDIEIAFHELNPQNCVVAHRVRWQQRRGGMPGRSEMNASYCCEPGGPLVIRGRATAQSRSTERVFQPPSANWNTVAAGLFRLPNSSNAMVPVTPS